MTVEIARSGHRVIVAAGNPIHRLLFELAANPPQLKDLQAALAELSAERKDGKRLELQILSIYTTHCENCGKDVIADAYIWNEKSNQIETKIYNCECGHGGEQPASLQDQEQADFWTKKDLLHRSMALERLAPGNDPIRQFAEEALSFYKPRAVYSFGTIINRLDRMSLSPEKKRNLLALILYAMDYSNSLWSPDSDRTRPKQLILSPRYFEHNVWKALESAIKYWDSPGKPVHLCLWPEEPPESGGISLFAGPLRDLQLHSTGTEIKAVICPIPRPNQAFWSFSALWSGWLWGNKAVGHFKSVMRRQRYDWDWHAEAVNSLLINVRRLVVDRGTPILGLISEPEAPFITATIMAGQNNGFEIKNITCEKNLDIIRINWSLPNIRDGSEKRSKKQLPLDVVFTRWAVTQILEDLKKPTDYLLIHCLLLKKFTEKGMLVWSPGTIRNIENNIHHALESPEFEDLDRRTIPENGNWGLRKWKNQDNLWEENK
ncbi:MAG: hypothetical protein WCP19_09230 [Chloroflexota bacterium]